MSTFTIAQGSMSANKDNVITGQLPRRVVIGLASNFGHNEIVDENRYNFEHFGLNDLTLHVGGDQFSKKPLTPTSPAISFVIIQMTLFECTGMLSDDRGHGIDREDFKKGYAMYAFDLMPDMAEGAHTNPIKYGNIRMDIHFAAALTATVNVIAYAEYDSLIQID